jgi:pilus assembly protein CpaB
MQRRIIAAVAAVLLAGIGAVLLYTYVNSAEARAMDGMASRDVLVATTPIPAGTRGDALGPFVALKKLPQIAVAQDALTDVADVKELVTTSELGIGEQILKTRFAAPDTTSPGEVEVPSDMQLVSITLEPTRTVGATIQPGNKIALLITGPNEADEGKPLTAQALRDVLVANVQGAVAGTDDDGSTPGGTLLLTLALPPKDVSRVVWAAENAKIWAALEPKDGDHGTIPFITGKNVLK